MGGESGLENLVGSTGGVRSGVTKVSLKIGPALIYRGGEEIIIIIIIVRGI